MARFERRKAPQQNQQPVGSIYSRSVNVGPQQNSNYTNQINQMLTVIKKHDNLITKLLKRFNDFENTIQVKIESLVDAKIREEMDALQAIKNSNVENNIINDNSNQTEEVVENKKVMQNANMEILMEHLKQIQSNMLIKDDLQKEIDSMKNQLKDINKSNMEHYQQFSEEQVRNLSKWMNDMNNIQDDNVVIEQYQEMKKRAFNNDIEIPEKKEIEKKVVDEVDLEIKTIKKNVKLEINETEESKETV
tara:strand:+ start:1899 stop:2642 length:744 start_codon:yes stop_codon:yes gene_type:complete